MAKAKVPAIGIGFNADASTKFSREDYMATMIKLRCAWCGKMFDKLLNEYNRQVRNGRSNNEFFCSLSCGSCYTNRQRGNFRELVAKTCPHCGREFTTRTDAIFCGRSCASAGSVTQYRHEQAQKTAMRNVKYILGIESIAKSLRAREAWKYEELRRRLESSGIEYEFEHVIGRYIYDLALFDSKLLIEFDGPNHQEAYQIVEDVRRTEVAIANGWELSRIEVESQAIIAPDLLYDIVESAI